jgi:hypothetical protein
MRSLSRLAALGVCLLSTSAFAEMVENPAYANWAKFKVGTSLTYSSEMQMQGMNMKSEMTQKLATLDADKAQIEMKMRANNMDMPPQTITIPAKVEKTQVQPEPALPPGMKGEVKVLGKEKLSVAGKELECQVVQFTSEQDGQKLTGKSWTSEQVPGGLVKTETTLPGDGAGRNTMTLTAMDLKQ